MSFPTVLGPWYVVQRINYSALDVPVMVEYYTAQEDSAPSFQPSKKLALLFMSLASAARVAWAETAEVRALTTREEAREFGRDQ